MAVGAQNRRSSFYEAIKKKPWVPLEVPTAYELELLLFSAAGKPLPMGPSPPPACRLLKRRIHSDFTHSLHKLQGEIENSQALPIPKAIGNLLVGIHLR
jgi:hypothetical protein